MSNNLNNHKTHYRRNITIIVAVISVLISATFFILMMQRLFYMHIIFYLTLGISFLIVAYLMLWTLSSYDRFARLAKYLKYGYFSCLLIGFLCFIILLVLIISGAYSEDTDVDVIIVLGAGVHNGRPSLMLVSRLDAAYEYMKAKENVPVIVTGGLGRGETHTEAEVMARYLIMRGIDEKRIWKEDTSTNTRENFAFSINILENKGMDTNNLKFAVISNEFHLYRAKVIAEKAGLDAFGVAAETPGFHRKILYFTREAFSLALELFFR